MNDPTKKLFYALLLLGVIGWNTGYVSAPLLKHYGLEKASDLVYWGYSITCHQMPERSFHLLGEKLAVCQRDAAIYAAFLTSVIAYPFLKKLGTIKTPKSWLLIAAFTPIVIDGGLQVLGIAESTPLRRTITGGLFGIIMPFFLIPLYYETLYLLEDWYKERVDKKRVDKKKS